MTGKNSSRFRNALYTSVALSLAISSAPSAMAAQTAASGALEQTAQASFGFERSTSMSDGQFLDLVSAELAASPDRAEAITARAKQLRPYLSEGIEEAAASPASGGSAPASDGPTILKPGGDKGVATSGNAGGVTPSLSATAWGFGAVVVGLSPILTLAALDGGGGG